MNREARVRGTDRELAVHIREDEHIVTEGLLPLCCDDDLVLAAPPFGGGVDVEDLHAEVAFAA